MCCSFVNISYFGLKFFQILGLNTFQICKNIDFFKPEHETTSLCDRLSPGASTYPVSYYTGDRAKIKSAFVFIFNKYNYCKLT